MTKSGPRPRILEVGLDLREQDPLRRIAAEDDLIPGAQQDGAPYQGRHATLAEHSKVDRIVRRQDGVERTASEIAIELSKQSIGAPFSA